MTFDRLFEIFIAEKEAAIRPSSLATFCQNWMSLSKHIADTEIEKFGRHNARSLMTGLLAEGLAVKTVKDRMTQVKQMLRFAAAELDIDVLSTEWGLKYPPAEPRRLKRFNAADVSALVREAERCLERGISSGVPMMIALFTGMRIGEVCGLQWGDIDYREGVITVRRQVISQYDPLTRQCFEILGAPKTRSGYREIPLVPALRRMLRLHGGRDPEPDCFVINNRPRPAAPRNVREQYDRLVTRAKVARVNFHGLRHTYATRLVETGGDLKTISVILGHADVTTTLNLYVHPSADAMRKIARKAFEKFD